MARLKGVSAVFVLLCLGLFAYGCGGDDGATQDQLDAAREEGAKEAEQQAKVNQLQKQVNQLRKKSNQGNGQNGGSQSQSGGSGGSGSSGGPVSSCAGGVQVGPNTSCDFAMNVAGEKGSNPGASSISAYSPVTGQYYTMSCGPWSGGGTVCTGGNGASVYLP
jgi:hypothetical protein